MISQKNFIVAAQNSNKEAFVLHIAYLSLKILINPAYKAQIA